VIGVAGVATVLRVLGVAGVATALGVLAVVVGATVGVASGTAGIGLAGAAAVLVRWESCAVGGV